MRTRVCEPNESRKKAIKDMFAIGVALERIYKEEEIFCCEMQRVVDNKYQWVVAYGFEGLAEVSMLPERYELFKHLKEKHDL